MSLLPKKTQSDQSILSILRPVDSIPAPLLDQELEASDSDLPSSVVEEIEITTSSTRLRYSAEEIKHESDGYHDDSPTVHISDQLRIRDSESNATNFDHQPEDDDECNSELDSTSESQFQLSARDQARGASQHQQQHRRRRMTAQLARQKAFDLSCEIGALKKIQERLERQRERLITMYLSITPSRNN